MVIVAVETSFLFKLDAFLGEAEKFVALAGTGASSAVCNTRWQSRLLFCSVPEQVLEG